MTGATLPSQRALGRLVEDMKVLVCVGSGGVGKTTSAAALALHAATLGKKTLVITIDPARRLANSLGIDELLHAPRRLDAARLQDAGIHTLAPIDAMMLDLRVAWDDMVARSGISEDERARILSNRFYQYLSRELPGAQEFIACEALYELAAARGYDLVVLDTPPTTNALDFLDAPSRVLSFLDHEALHLFWKDPRHGGRTRAGMRFLDAAAGAASAVLARFTGTELLSELGDFLWLLRSLVDPLVSRTRGFEALLRGPTSRFVVVTSPAAGPLREARFFVDELQARSLSVGSVVVNRVMPAPAAHLEELTRDALIALWDACALPALETQDAGVLCERLIAAQGRAAERDRAAIAALRDHALAQVPCVEVPLFAEDVYDVTRLAALIPCLVGEPD